MRLGAALRQRCPRCLEGAIFEGLWRTRTDCPRCGLRFEREPGYFLGAMYFSYALSLVAGAPFATAAWMAGWPALETSLAGLVPIVLALPLSFRLSRSLWLHFDQHFDPR